MTEPRPAAPTGEEAETRTLRNAAEVLRFHGGDPLADDLDAIASRLTAQATALAALRARVKLLDRVIGEHHSASVMREEHHVCPVCTEHGGVAFFRETRRLLQDTDPASAAVAPRQPAGDPEPRPPKPHASWTPEPRVDR